MGGRRVVRRGDGRGEGSGEDRGVRACGERGGGVTTTQLPDAMGHFGPYGGRFVPETLMVALNELTVAYEEARDDETFQAELVHLLRTYVGRPTALYYA